MFERLRNKNSSFVPPDSIPFTEWDTCCALFKTVPWQKAGDDQRVLRQRAVTWAHVPYRYALYDNEIQVGRRSGGISRTLLLRRIAGPNQITGLYDVTDFCTTNKVLFAVIHSAVDLSDGEISADEERMHKEADDFTVAHGLYIPTAEDELELSHAVKQAYLDGVEPFYGR